MLNILLFAEIFSLVSSLIFLFFVLMDTFVFGLPGFFLSDTNNFSQLKLEKKVKTFW